MSQNAAQILSMVVVLVLSGLLCYQHLERGELARERRTLVAEVDQLTDNLMDEKEKVERLRTRNRELDRSLAEFESAATKNTDGLLEARALAGLEPLTGPGVLVTLEDGDVHQQETGTDPEACLVHDTDLTALVNELWASGAEAISINGERLTVRSPIRCAGPTILINEDRAVAPFRVKAVGPAREMARGLRMGGGWLDSMEVLTSHGGTVTIEETEDLKLPAYDGSSRFIHAKPSKRQG